MNYKSQLISENQRKIYPCSPHYDKIEILNHFECVISTGDFLPMSPEAKKKHIRERTKNVIGKLIEIISRINDEEFSKIDCDKYAVMTKLNRLSDYLGLCIDSFLVGNITQCHKSINNLIYEYLKPRIMPIAEKQSFYRMRPKNNVKRMAMTHNEMFHIPFDKIELVSNQRYSLSGYPSLYLGSNLKLCWYETGTPNYSEYFASHFSNTTRLELLDMTFPSEVKCENDILWIALILATSIPKKPIDIDNQPFVPEYIISQSILHSLIKRETDRKINGIVYTSSKYYNMKESFTKYEDSFNYVFPSINKNYRINGHCEDLLKMFQNTIGIPCVIDDRFIETEESLKNTSFPEKLSGIYRPIYKDRTLLNRNPFL